MNRFIIRSCLIAIGLAGSLVGGHAIGAIEPEPQMPDPRSIKPWIVQKPLEAADQAMLWQLLVDAKLDDLDNEFTRYLLRVKKDPLAEATLIQAFRTFECTGTDWGLSESRYDKIDVWVRAHPKSSAALTARSHCRAQIGWAHRGGDWANRTSQAKFEAMSRMHAQAEEDARAAIALDATNPGPYRVLLQIAKNQGAAAFAAIAKEATSRFPSSFSIWANVLDARRPRWGGSLAEVADLARQAQAHVADNPRLETLLGEPFYFAGQDAETADRYDDALRLYTEALAFGDDEEIMFSRVRVARRLKRFDMARQDVIRAYTLFPDLNRNPPLQGYLNLIDQESIRSEHAKD